MSRNNEQHKVRELAGIIMKVRAGLMTAKEAAQTLGISRKTYYQREQKALAAMMTALEPGKAGRPKTSVDTQKESLLAANKQLLQKLSIAEARLKIQSIIHESPIPQVDDIPVKKKKKNSDDSGDSSSDG